MGDSGQTVQIFSRLISTDIQLWSYLSQWCRLLLGAGFFDRRVSRQRESHGLLSRSFCDTLDVEILLLHYMIINGYFSTFLHLKNA